MYEAAFNISIDNNFSAPEITAVPNNGYRFLRWSDGQTSPTRHDVNINKSFSVTAEFIVIYELNFEAQEGGYIIGEAHQIVDDGKSSTSVTAVANEGYEFDCWKYEEYGSTYYLWNPTITIDTNSQNISSLLRHYTYIAVFKKIGT